MNIVNKVRVTICGKDYSLQTDETPEYISALAAKTEKQIYDLIRLKPGFGVQNAAVFVALTSLDEAEKSEKSIEDIRGQIKSSMAEAGRARAAKEKLSARVKELEGRIAELEKENKELKKRNPAFDCEQLVLENTISPAVTVYAGDASENVGEMSAVPDQQDEPGDPEKKRAADMAGKFSGNSPAGNGEKTPEKSEQKNQSNQPAQSNQSSGNSSGDLVSRSRQEQKGKEAKPEAGGETGGDKTDRPGKAPDHDRGGAAETESNGNSPQDDNMNKAGNTPAKNGAAR